MAYSTAEGVDFKAQVYHIPEENTVFFAEFCTLSSCCAVMLLWVTRDNLDTVDQSLETLLFKIFFLKIDTILKTYAGYFAVDFISVILLIFNFVKYLLPSLIRKPS